MNSETVNPILKTAHLDFMKEYGQYYVWVTNELGEESGLTAHPTLKSAEKRLSNLRDKFGIQNLLKHI